MVVEKLVEDTEQIITRSSYTVLLPVYSVAAFVVSIIFINGAKEAKTPFTVIQLLLLAAIAIALFVLYAISKSIRKATAKAMADKVKADSLINRLNKMAISDEGQQYVTSLKKLRDELRFIDTSSVAPEDDDIDLIISTIEMEFAKSADEISEEEIQNLLLKLNSLIAKRKTSVSMMKKGRFKKGKQ